MSQPHVVVIGGGFAGLSAGRVLRNTNCRVTLLDRRNHHVFQPLLYQVATATLSPGDIAAPIRWILRKARNVRVLLAEATRIDVAARQVHLSDGSPIAYDFLVVGTGASHTYFGHNEWGIHAQGLKTLEDALEMRRRLLLAFERAERESDPARQRELLTFVLVGGGPTGVELAGTLAEIARQTLRDEFRSIDTSAARASDSACWRFSGLKKSWVNDTRASVWNRSGLASWNRRNSSLVGSTMRNVSPMRNVNFCASRRRTIVSF